MTFEEKQQRYVDLVHQVQCGVAMMLDKSSSATPKHLRTGVNIGMVEHGALVGILVKKGLFTKDEYVDALIERLEKEVNDYKNQIRKAYNMPSDAKVTLV